MRWLAKLLVCAATIAWNGVAYGRGAAQLRFVQQVEDNRCPDEAELRRRVGAQLGYDPFDASAATRIEATLERKGSRFHGRVIIQREDATVGERELDPTKDCEALVSALALTISVAIDPIGVSRDAEPPSTSSVVTPAAMVTRPEEPTGAQPSRPVELGAGPAPPSASRASLRLAVAPIVSIGVAPAAAPGLSASIGAGWPNLSLALEGRLDLPASARLSIGSTTTDVPCSSCTTWTSSR